MGEEDGRAGGDREIAEYGYPPCRSRSTNAASTRGGVKGRSLNQTPVASWIAIATAGANGTIGISATPRESSTITSVLSATMRADAPNFTR